MADRKEVEDLISSCLEETTKASRKKYDQEMAERTAAMFLVAQMKISFLIEEVELASKQAKNEIARLEAEKYFECKTSNVDKKITESMLTNFVAKNSEVMSAKTNAAQAEASLKKWSFILNTLKDGHIYFRNIGKTKSWAE
jgi:hypothetical protein